MIEIVVDKLIALLGPIATLTKEKRELRDDALKSISHALIETHHYYNNFKVNFERDVEKEKQLAHYWAAAAIPLRHVENEIAQLCEAKSGYWINPDQYDRNEIAKLGIRLEDISQAYFKLAYPKGRKS